jgi:hypothetical protein
MFFLFLNLQNLARMDGQLPVLSFLAKNSSFLLEFQRQLILLVFGLFTWFLVFLLKLNNCHKF